MAPVLLLLFLMLMAVFAVIAVMSQRATRKLRRREDDRGSQTEPRRVWQSQNRR